MNERIYIGNISNESNSPSIFGWFWIAFLVVGMICGLVALTTQPAQAACEQFTLVYGPKEIKTSPPVDKWGHQISPPASLSQTVGDSVVVTGFAYSKDTVDDPATPEVEKPGEACTP